MNTTENFVRDNPILRWLILPILIAAIISFADYGCAAERINLSAEKVFEMTAGKMHVAGKYKTFAENRTNCQDDKCSFWGWMNFPIGEEILESAATTWHYTKKDNKIFKYNVNVTMTPETAPTKFLRIVRQIAKQYGEPKTSEDVTNFRTWLFDKNSAVVLVLPIRNFTATWDFPELRCTAKLSFDTIYITEENK